MFNVNYVTYITKEKFYLGVVTIFYQPYTHFAQACYLCIFSDFQCCDKMLRNSYGLVPRLVKTRNIFQMKTGSLTVRFFSSHHLDSNDYIQALYNKLSVKDPYSFLDQNIKSNRTDKVDDKLSSSPEFKEFLNIIAKSDDSDVSSEMSEIQNIFSQKFEEWTRVSQLRVGFLMHLDKRINSGDYLSKMIKHMCRSNPYEMGTHDLTALMLLIYFKRDLTLDDLSEYIDPLALQTSLALKIKNKGMSEDEVCAVCLGLKRIAEMKVTCSHLRRALYDRLSDFQTKKDPLDDFFVMTLITTLSKGNQVFNDDIMIVQKMISNMSNQVASLNFDTAIKIMTFPLTLGFSNKVIETEVFSKLKANLLCLHTWDIVQMCLYISKQCTEVPSSYDIVEYLERKMDDLKTLDELVDLIECFHYLSHKNIYSEKFNDVIFSSMNSLPSSLFSPEMVPKEVAKDMVSIMRKSLGVCNVPESYNHSESNKFISSFTRIPAFISSGYNIDTGNKDNLIEKERLAILLKSQHKRLPIELFAPQMSTRNLDKRSKQLINCYRALVKFMGTEHYVGVTRILPHFTEPDLVFGNIGGNCLTIPGWLTDPDFAGYRKPPPGDWWAVIIGTRKTHDLAGNIIGQEAAKVRQIKALGYSPIVIPYADLGNTGQSMNSLARLLKTEHVSLPNLDDGMRETKRKF